MTELFLGTVYPVRPNDQLTSQQPAVDIACTSIDDALVQALAAREALMATGQSSAEAEIRVYRVTPLDSPASNPDSPSDYRPVRIASRVPNGALVRPLQHRGLGVDCLAPMMTSSVRAETFPRTLGRNDFGSPQRRSLDVRSPNGELVEVSVRPMAQIRSGLSLFAD